MVLDLQTLERIRAMRRPGGPDLLIRVTGTGGLNGSNSRGLDCRGVTRGKIGNLTVIDAGFGAINTSEAIFVTASDDLQMANVTVTDTRAGVARTANPAQGRKRPGSP